MKTSISAKEWFITAAAMQENLYQWDLTLQSHSYLNNDSVSNLALIRQEKAEQKTVISLLKVSSNCFKHAV